MFRLFQTHPAAQGQYEPKRERSRLSSQAQRAAVGLGLLALSLLFVTVLAVKQDADKGFWWPLTAWMQR